MDEVRAEANRVINELEEIRKQEKTKDTKMLLEQAEAMRSGSIDRMYHIANVVIERKSDENYQLPRDLRRGDAVLVYSMNQKGQVLENIGKNKKALVQIGQMKMRVSIKDLRLLEKNNQASKPSSSFSTTRTVSRKNAGSTVAEIDLRGKNVEESLLELDQFIDHAVLSKLNQITIIHGKGTGALRKAVQTHLKKHPNIQSYRLGVFGEGESGVTIALLH